MKKSVILCMVGLAALLALAGCSSGTEAASGSNAKRGKIKLGEYKGVEVSRKSYDVTDDEVDARISSLLEPKASYEKTDQPAAIGDEVIIDYVGTKDGEAFKGGSAEGYKLQLGSRSMIDGFEDGLVGYKAGEEVVLNLTFPEYYTPELAGADVVFHVKLKEVKAKVLPELTDAFVRENYEFDTVEAFREDARNEILNAKKEAADSQKEYEALQAVVANSQIVCAQKDVDKQYEALMEDYTMMAASNGIGLEDYVALTGGTMDGFKEELQKSAQNFTKQTMVVKAVAKKEKIKVTDGDRRSLAEEYGTDLRTLISQSGQEAVDEVALARKVTKFLADNAVEVEKADGEQTQE